MFQAKVNDTMYASFYRFKWAPILFLCVLATGCLAPEEYASSEQSGTDEIGTSANASADEESSRQTAAAKQSKSERTEALAESAAAAEQEWHQFRGPQFRSETSLELPIEWSRNEGILWKSGLPGRGASTPVIAGDRVFVTCYDGFGLTADAEGNSDELRHHLICFDRETGSAIWHREITGTRLKQKMNPELARHGFASSTPVTDGENVYVFFGVTGVFAFSSEGDCLWQRNLGLNTHYFGSSASPVLYDDLVIVNASIESNTVYALDKQTGAAVWKIPDINECWSVPIVGTSSDGRAELIISSKNRLQAFAPESGELLWHCQGIQDYVVSVPIIVDGVCYLTGGKTKQTMAVKLGGNGDVEATHKVWEIGKIGSNVSSPVFRDNRLFIFHDSGVIQVIDAANGDLLKRKRTATRDRPFASPLLAGGHLYMPFQDSGISVFEADEECEEISVVEEDGQLPLMASIVPVGNRFLYRDDQSLTCVDGKATSTSDISWQVPANTQVVETIESWNIDPEKGWARRYLGFLTADYEKTIKFLLMPYQSVITDEQTEQSREIIFGEKPKYDALREKLEALQWDELTAPAEQGAKFHEAYAGLESATRKLNSETRILVKKLFPEEQLQQHYRDAEAGKAHLKPGNEKQ